MKLKHKIIDLLPTDIQLEVFIGDKKEIVKKMKGECGKKKSYWKEVVGDAPCVDMSPKGNHIYMFLTDFDAQTIVHESVHVSWYLDDIVGLNLNYDSQETQAYMVDYVFGEIMKMK